jgi:hypothetical protein
MTPEFFEPVHLREESWTSRSAETVRILVGIYCSSEANVQKSLLDLKLSWMAVIFVTPELENALRSGQGALQLSAARPL